MVSAQSFVQRILKNQPDEPVVAKASVYAPANIALIKYWGKRDILLNLPNTASLSISLGKKGTHTEISRASGDADEIILNDQLLSCDNFFVTRLQQYLDLFRPHPQFYFSVQTLSTVPVAAGLASSASGFAAMILALRQFFGWSLPEYQLSLLARLGSGSACRSLWQGFVYWQQGEAADGFDSYAMPLADTWPDLRIGLVIISDKAKATSSRDGMLHTVKTSPLYCCCGFSAHTACY